ncbi:hypothetical protein Mgra_00004085 [Meloidogyne graminicola]|uniref:Synembryn n=1 Tax=Meloidogyne graminicola TaxID=189291 RepID=A0A8S9ZTC4_9BILA|nr:hypothetical protein Mgra_00004085 [Meloidogyne graminicola]
MSENEDYSITSKVIAKWTEYGLDSSILNKELNQIINKYPTKMFPIICSDAKEPISSINFNNKLPLFPSFIFPKDFTIKIIEFENSAILRLNFLRICLRDKQLAESIYMSPVLLTLLDITFLNEHEFNTKCSTKVIIEASKCLVNFFFNSSLARSQFIGKSFNLLLSRISYISPIIKEQNQIIFSNNDEYKKFPYLNNWNKKDLEELLLLDMKIVFVVSAQEKQLQIDCLNDANKIKIFQQILAYTNYKLANSEIVSFISPFINETLLILFNFFHQIIHHQQQQHSNTIFQLCASECLIILQNSFLDIEIKQNAINLMATIPNNLLSLCPKVEDSSIDNKNIFEGYDIRFLDILLKILEEHIDQYEKINAPAFSEHLAMFLRMLTTLCADHKVARRFCRLKVIPPLMAEDVKQRPDVGSSFRNKLVRLISSIGALSNASSDFLFVLCKRSVGRLIKYTGFGHAAGLLADRGMLGSALTPKHPSDSEDSETEDYKKVENEVNPVTGYIPPPGQLEEFRRQFESMSDEQKEHEAMKLVNAMDKLMDQGIIAPGMVGEDGHVRQVKHVAELIKDVKNEKEDGSD